jgi:hypothetical protein
MPEKPINITLPRSLGDGLILRRSTRADADALITFTGRIHSEEGPEKPDEKVMDWTRDLMQKPHPTFEVGDFTIVEDTKTGEIVSCINLISQTWSYAGIPFGVGRPELVGTHPDYRHRGLIRAQFEVIHQWSAERGELLQGITGIPYYYRMFGYEMALSLGGGWIGYPVHVPRLKESEPEPYRVRAAAAADLPFFAAVYAEASKRYLVAAVWDEALWRYDLSGKSPFNVNRRVMCTIETLAGEPVGLLLHSPWSWGPTLPVFGYELKAGVSWQAVTPSVLRYLQVTGEAYAERDKKEPFGAYYFNLGTEHPVYQAIPSRLARYRQPYAWYIRVPDLPGFLRHIRPVLEKRMADSVLVGYTGEVKLTFYRDGLYLRFKDGRLLEVNNWTPEPVNLSGDAAFPELTFLKLLFGYRTLAEIEYAFPDCWVDKEETRVLLGVLFPKLVSDVWMIS